MFILIVLAFNDFYARGINCKKKATTIIEHIICSVGTLILHDDSVSKAYSNVMTTTQGKRQLKRRTA